MQIIEINAILGQQQIITILSTFKLIEDRDSDTIQNYKLKNAKKCIQWCIKNKKFIIFFFIFLISKFKHYIILVYLIIDNIYVL